LDHALLALHGLAVKKSGTADDVAAVMDMAPKDVADALEHAQAAGEVVGARGIFMLTPVGRARLDAAYPAEFATLREEPGFGKAYERFETVNRRLLDLMTRWQTVTRAGATIENDHSDPDYDAAIVDELGELGERAEKILSDFIQVVPRFSVYRDRLAAAYDKVLAGDFQYVSAVRIDSYHTVWFEMHEDLLRLLGRTREE